jgi:branched-subunit amino acid ABC-type transport system permease component
MWTDLLQHLVNGLMVGAIVALPALGLTLIFSVLGFINFSVAAQMTAGAYAGWLVNKHFGFPLVPCLLVAFSAAGALGVLADRLALAPMRRKPSAHAALMVAVVSIALNLVLENMFRFTFGSGLNSYEFAVARDIQIAGIRVGPQQARNFLLAVGITAAMAAFFSLTRVGKAMRAVADNPDLARLKGISPQKLTNIATFIGMGLAGVGGALLGMDTSVDPSTGARLVLVIFAASVLGGLTSLSGAVVGGLLMGVVSEMALIWIAPVYQSATAFVAILLVLLFRPTGLFAGYAGVKR